MHVFSFSTLRLLTNKQMFSIVSSFVETFKAL